VSRPKIIAVLSSATEKLEYRFPGKQTLIKQMSNSELFTDTRDMVFKTRKLISSAGGWKTHYKLPNYIM